MVLKLTLLLIDICQRLTKLARQHLCQEAQTPRIDTNDRRSFGKDTVGSLEERTVTTDRDRIVDIKVVIIKHAVGVDIDMQRAREVFKEGTVNVHLCLTLMETGEHLLDARTLACTILVFEKGETQPLIF